MEPESSLSLPQLPATSLCPESDEFISRFPFYIFSIHFNILLHSTHRSSKQLLSFVLHTKNPGGCAFVFSHLCVCFYYPAVICCKVQAMKLLFMQCSAVFSCTCSLGPNMYLCVLLSNTFTVCPYINTSDTLSHLYKVKGKIIVLYVLIRISSRQQTERPKCNRHSLNLISSQNLIVHAVLIC